MTIPNGEHLAPPADVWTPTRVGRIDVKNRLVMAPMTRSRALPSGVPLPQAATYYAQRSGLGLIISEGAQPSDQGQGYVFTPGIYTDAHVQGWRQIADAVHEANAHLYIQLMHVGRMSHPDNAPEHMQAVAPSSIAPQAQMFTVSGMQAIPTPRALTIDDIDKTVDEFAEAARRAIEAGADGVEIHGANGYLLQQFMAPNANTRTDAYGGSIENRVRFTLEVARRIASEIGPDRTGIRLSPGATLGDLDEGPEGPGLYRHLVGELDKLGLAYLHLMHLGDDALLADLRAVWRQALIVNRPARSREAIGQDIASGLADLESYGQFVLANPDFTERLQTGAAFNTPDRATYFGGTDQGYTDYPQLNAQKGA